MVAITPLSVAIALLSSGLGIRLSHAAENATTDASTDAAKVTASDTLDGDASSAAPLSATLKWGDCSLQASLKSAAFECTKMVVPMCYEDAGLSCGKGNSRTHSLTILRRGSVAGPTKPTVWVVADTSDTNDIAQLMYDLSQGDKVQVFALQLRPWELPMEEAIYSTPRTSTPCGDLTATYGSRMQVDTPTMDAAKVCSDWLTENFGVNGINAFSLDTAAKDLTRTMSLVQKLEPSTTKSGVTLLSSGRASRVVQRFMAQNENSKDAPAVSGYIFDTPHAMKLEATQDQITGAALDRFISSCDNDALCKSKFANISTTMSNVLKTTYKMLDMAGSTSCVTKLKENSYDNTRDLKPSHGARRFFTALHKLSEPGLKLLAPLLYRLHRCNADDANVLKDLLDSMKREIDSSNQIAASELRAMQWFVDRSITFSEFWPTSSPSRDQLVETFESMSISDGAMVLQQPSFCVHTGGSAAGCSALYKRESDVNKSLVLTYKPLALASKTSVSATTGLIGSTTADVLILTSRLNPTGSSDVSRQLYEAFGSDVTQRVLIQSDNLAGNRFLGNRTIGAELSGSHRETLVRVVGLFVAKKAKVLNGKWYVNDLKAFDFTSETGSLTSTYESAPVAVNFTTTQADVMAWNPFSQGRDLYETGKRPLSGTWTSPCTSRSCLSDYSDKVSAALIFGLSGLAFGLLIGGCGLVCCGGILGFVLWRKCRSRQHYHSSGKDSEAPQHQIVAVAYPDYQHVQASYPPPQQAYHHQQPSSAPSAPYTQQYGYYEQNYQQPGAHGTQHPQQQTWG